MSEKTHNYFFGQMNAPWKNKSPEKRFKRLICLYFLVKDRSEEYWADWVNYPNLYDSDNIENTLFIRYVKKYNQVKRLEKQIREMLENHL